MISPSVHLLTANVDADGDGTTDCEWFDVGCGFGNAVQGATNSAVESLASSVMEGLVNTVTDLGTMWVEVPTVNVTGGNNTAALPSDVAGQEQISRVLDYVQWGGFAIAILGLLVLGATMAFEGRRGRGGVFALGRIGLVVGGTILIAAAAGITAALMGDGPQGGGSRAVAFIQGSLWWYIAALVVLSIIVGAVRMIWEQRAQPGQDLVKSLLKFIVVSGAGVTVAGLLITASDEFSVWILSRSMECDVAANSACFEDGLKLILGLTGQSYWSSLGAILIIVVGLIALLIGLVQLLLMIARSALLVLLVGLLPAMAAATNTEMGQQWFKRGISWLIALILYKPAAAIIYAVGFQLVGSMIDAQNETIDLQSVVSGVMLLLLSVVALPALIRFVAPMTAAVNGSGGGGSGAALAAAAALPTGAAMLGRAFGGRGSGSSGAVPPSGAGPTGGRTTGTTTTSRTQTGGAPGPSGSGSGNGSGGSGTPTTSGPRPDAGAVPAGAGTSGNGQQAAAQASTQARSAAAQAGSSAAAVPAGGPAGSGSTASGASAAGPMGMAAGAAIQAGQKAKEATETVAQDAIGEGPSGSSK